MPPDQSSVSAASPVITPITSASSLPQKSTFWIWTTLWLTTLFDAFLVSVVCALLLYFVAGKIPLEFLPVITFIEAILVPVGAMGLGSFTAVSDVLRRSLIPKDQAGKLAGLAVIVPIVGSLCFIVAEVVALRTTLSVPRLSEVVGVGVFCLGLMYWILRSQLEKNGV